MKGFDRHGEGTADSENIESARPSAPNTFGREARSRFIALRTLAESNSFSPVSSI
jgi:hypothetical protein